jgi:hypothetical protein
MRRVEVIAILVGFLIAGAILLQASGALANDSTARLGAGGITFTKSEHIRMLEEVLEISTKTIRVRYRFLNESDKDIHATIAFPLPHCGWLSVALEGPPGEPSPGHILTTFKVLADGHPVSTQVESKAVMGESDVTAQLRGLGLSDRQIFNFDLTPDQLEALKNMNGGKAKLLDGNAPGWKIAETAFWQQTFPAGKEIAIEHDYEPVVGQGPNLPYSRGAYGFDIPTAHPDGQGDVCLDDVTKRAIENRIRAYLAKDGSTSLTFADVEYILGTGRNWKEPIGEFTLRIDKETPDTFVSLCFPGKPKKVSPTVYEFYQKDFVPPDKLVVYFYTVIQIPE